MLLALWRALELNKRGGFAAAFKRPSRNWTQSIKPTAHGEAKRRAEKGEPANPLGRRPFLYRAAVHAFYRPFRRLLHRCLIHGFLSVPIWFPFGYLFVPRTETRFVVKFTCKTFSKSNCICEFTCYTPSQTESGSICLSSAERKRKRTFRQGCTEQLRCPWRKARIKEMYVLAYAFPFCFVLAERQTKNLLKKE